MEAVVTLELPRRLIKTARITPDELKVELAIQLYQTHRLGIGHARELAGLSLWEFRQLLATRKIAPHYDTADLAADMQTWVELDAQ